IPRCIDGSTPRRCDLVDWKYSLRTSPIVRIAARRYLSGLTKNEYQALLWPRPCFGSLIVDMVMYERAASPDTRLPTLAPSFDNRPSPFDARRTISAASSGWFDTSMRCVSFSHQRKAGMKLLLPCRIPACDADVCEGSRAVHLSSFIWPDRTQCEMNGTRPARICCARIGCARPSIWTITRPGELVTIVSGLLRASCATSVP